ncbi:MAG: hypothetical protein LAP85_20850 [Acidobacteriia bacterium]|nr:hypothetical protein [Terriglobia bacterium]
MRLRKRIPLIIPIILFSGPALTVAVRTQATWAAEEGTTKSEQPLRSGSVFEPRSPAPIETPLPAAPPAINGSFDAAWAQSGNQFPVVKLNEVPRELAPVDFLAQAPVIDGVLDPGLRGLPRRAFSQVDLFDTAEKPVDAQYRLAYGTQFLYVYVEARGNQLTYNDRAYQRTIGNCFGGAERGWRTWRGRGRQYPRFQDEDGCNCREATCGRRIRMAGSGGEVGRDVPSRSPSRSQCRFRAHFGLRDRGRLAKLRSPDCLSQPRQGRQSPLFLAFA